MHKVTFLPEKTTVTVPSVDTLLDGARRAGIRINAACGGKGDCGKCKVIIRKGEVECAPTRHITEDQRRAGYILACQNRPLSDLVVEVPPETREEHVQALGEQVALMDFDAGSRIRVDLSAWQPTEVDPVVKRLQVRVAPPSLEETTADLERVCENVAGQCDVRHCTASLSALRELPGVLRMHDWQASASVHVQDGTARVISIGAPTQQPHCGLAIDIGTTTVVVQLVDLQSGQVLGTRGTLNQQASYGEDVLSRIIHACEDRQLDALHQLVVDTINHLVSDLCENHDRKPGDVHCAVCAGNSTMIHLFLAISPCTIRREPFVSVTNFPPSATAAELGLKILPEAPVVIAPGISGYVGGDIDAGVLASGLAKQEEPCVLIDVGTNGEVVVGNRDWLISCASSAGPAFEGGGIRCGMRAARGAVQKLRLDTATGQASVAAIEEAPARGICGSGVIDTLAELLRAGFIDRAGKFADLVPHDLLRATDGDKEFVLVPASEAGVEHDIVISEAEIAHVIRSKGAIFTATSLLLEKVGLSVHDIHTFYVAGGFGTYLNLDNAILIGLLPDLPRERFSFIGNASLAGARMALLDQRQRQELTAIAERMTYIELSVEAQFMDRYVASLFLPHTDASLFPTVMKELAHGGSRRRAALNVEARDND